MGGHISVIQLKALTVSDPNPRNQGQGKGFCSRAHERSKLFKPDCTGPGQCLSMSYFESSWLSNHYFANIITLLECATAFFH